MSVAKTIQSNIELEDKAMATYIEKHNSFISTIESYDMDAVAPTQIARMEYLYAQAQLYAYLIAGHYRKKQRYHEALAEQQQANSYEETRKGDRPATDAQYISRRAKGKQLELAGHYEGNYIRWNGIAQAYENSINSLKDLGKAIVKEGG